MLNQNDELTLSIWGKNSQNKPLPSLIKGEKRKHKNKK